MRFGSWSKWLLDSLVDIRIEFCGDLFPGGSLLRFMAKWEIGDPSRQAPFWFPFKPKRGPYFENPPFEIWIIWEGSGLSSLNFSHPGGRTALSITGAHAFVSRKWTAGPVSRAHILANGFPIFRPTHMDKRQAPPFEPGSPLRARGAGFLSFLGSPGHFSAAAILFFRPAPANPSSRFCSQPNSATPAARRAARENFARASAEASSLPVMLGVATGCWRFDVP